MPDVILKPKEDRRLRAGHLWVFNNEIAEVRGDVENGEVVTVVTSDGRPVGTGYYNKHSLIALRLLTRGRERWSNDLLRERIARAVAHRERLFPGVTACRLIYGEGDLLPGLVVDRYDNWLVVQLMTLGMERQSETIVALLDELIKPSGMVLRNDSPYREKEGLKTFVDVVKGETGSPNTIDENGARFEVDLVGGQKTGFFFDQRDSRALVRELARGKRVLDTFCYSGGFSINAALGGAVEVTAVDISEDAIALMQRNSAMNNVTDNVSAVAADCFDFLREQAADTRQYDLIIIDPPAFVKSKTKLADALRGYREINRTAMKLLAPEGMLLSCSCSYQLDEDNFIKMLRGASRDVNRAMRIRYTGTQSQDHPVLLGMPETQYLKVALLESVM